MEKVVMERKKYLIALVAAVLVAMGSRAAAQDRLVLEGKDPATGATARVYRTATGPRIDLETPTVHLRKQLIGTTVVTTLTGGGESLTIETDTHALTVTGRRGRVTVTEEDPRGSAKAKQFVAESPIAARAAALIAKFGFGANSPLQPLLLTTRAFLLAARDDDSGTRELTKWMEHARTRVRVVKTAGGQRTPTECWDAYGDELVEAFTDYAECVKNLKWWDPIGEPRCAVVYEVRIIGAFAWYMDCVKLPGLFVR